MQATPVHNSNVLTMSFNTDDRTDDPIPLNKKQKVAKDVKHVDRPELPEANLKGGVNENKRKRSDDAVVCISGDKQRQRSVMTMWSCICREKQRQGYARRHNQLQKCVMTLWLYIRLDDQHQS